MVQSEEKHGAEVKTIISNMQVSDPVAQAIIDNVAGKMPTKKQQILKCDLCNVTLNGPAMVETHNKGAKHKKKLFQAQLAQAERTPATEGTASSGHAVSSSEGKTPSVQGTAANGNPALSQGSTTTKENPALSQGSTTATRNPALSQGSMSTKALENPALNQGSTTLGNPALSHGSKISDGNPALDQASTTTVEDPFLPEVSKTEEIVFKKAPEPGNSVVPCKVCRIWVNTAVQLKFHEAGKQHKRRLAEKTAIVIIPDVKPIAPEEPLPDYIEEKTEGKLKLFTCKLCNKITNSRGMLKIHLEARIHKMKTRGVFGTRHAPYTTKKSVAKASFNSFRSGGVLGEDRLKRPLTDSLKGPVSYPNYNASAHTMAGQFGFTETPKAYTKGYSSGGYNATSYDYGKQNYDSSGTTKGFKSKTQGFNNASGGFSQATNSNSYGYGQGSGYTQNSYGGNSYGAKNSGADTGTSYGAKTFGADTATSYGTKSFRGNNYGAKSFGVNSYGADSGTNYEAKNSGADTVTSYGNTSYGANNYGGNDYRAKSYGGDSYGGDTRASYGGDSSGTKGNDYGNDSYGANCNGEDSFGAKSYGTDSYKGSYDSGGYGGAYNTGSGYTNSYGNQYDKTQQSRGRYSNLFGRRNQIPSSGITPTKAKQYFNSTAHQNEPAFSSQTLEFMSLMDL